MTWVYFLGGFLVVSLAANMVGWRYWLNLWYAFDCFLNALRGGDPRETISSAWGKAIARGSRPAILAAKCLFLTGHFKKSINEKVGGRRVPDAMVVVGIIFLIVAVKAVFFP